MLLHQFYTDESFYCAGCFFAISIPGRSWTERVAAGLTTNRLQKLGIRIANCLWLPFQPVSGCCPGPSLHKQERRLVFSEAELLKDLLLYLGKVLIQSLNWTCAWPYTLQLGPEQPQSSSERILAGPGQAWPGELAVKSVSVLPNCTFTGWILPSEQPFFSFNWFVVRGGSPAAFLHDCLQCFFGKPFHGQLTMVHYGWVLLRQDSDLGKYIF